MIKEKKVTVIPAGPGSAEASAKAAAKPVAPLLGPIVGVPDHIIQKLNAIRTTQVAPKPALQASVQPKASSPSSANNVVNHPISTSPINNAAAGDAQAGNGVAAMEVEEQGVQENQFTMRDRQKFTLPSVRKLVCLTEAHKLQELFKAEPIMITEIIEYEPHLASNLLRHLDSLKKEVDVYPQARYRECHPSQYLIMKKAVDPNSAAWQSPANWRGDNKYLGPKKPITHVAGIPKLSIPEQPVFQTGAFEQFCERYKVLQYKGIVLKTAKDYAFTLPARDVATEMQRLALISTQLGGLGKEEKAIGFGDKNFDISNDEDKTPNADSKCAKDSSNSADAKEDGPTNMSGGECHKKDEGVTDDVIDKANDASKDEDKNVSDDTKAAAAEEKRVFEENQLVIQHVEDPDRGEVYVANLAVIDSTPGRERAIMQPLIGCKFAELTQGEVWRYDSNVKQWLQYTRPKLPQFVDEQDGELRVASAANSKNTEKIPSKEGNTNANENTTLDNEEEDAQTSNPLLDTVDWTPIAFAKLTTYNALGRLPIERLRVLQGKMGVQASPDQHLGLIVSQLRKKGIKHEDLEKSDVNFIRMVTLKSRLRAALGGGPTEADMEQIIMQERHRWDTGDDTAKTTV